MRSIVLLLAASLLLAACLSPSGDTSAPQTPLPSPTLGVRDTPTLIPTSTPHPDFLSLQEKISASGETFTLTQDGKIEMWTEEEGARIVPGIQVHPDGTMTFTHNGQEFQADPDTLTIEGQTLTFEGVNGEIWVYDKEGLQSEAVALAKEDFEKYGYEFSEDYEIIDDQGWVKITDPETGRDIYVNGKFDLRFAVENATNLVPTMYKPIPKELVGVPFRPQRTEASGQYFVSLFSKMREEFINRYGEDPFDSKKSTFTPIMLDPDILAWGLVAVVDRDAPNEQYLVYEIEGGYLVIVPLKPGSREQVLKFWLDSDK